jgi:hypothetical protein
MVITTKPGRPLFGLVYLAAATPPAEHVGKPPPNARLRNSLRIGGTHWAYCIQPPGLLAHNSTSQAHVLSAARAEDGVADASRNANAEIGVDKRFRMFSPLL